MQSGNADFSVTETSSTHHVVRFALVAEEDFVKLTLRRLFRVGITVSSDSIIPTP